MPGSSGVWSSQPGNGDSEECHREDSHQRMQQAEGLCYLRKTNQTENPINANRPIRNSIAITSTVRSSARRVNAV